MHIGRWPLFATAAVAFALVVWGGLDVLNAIFTGMLVVLVPVIAVAQLRLVDLSAVPRRMAYLNSMTTMMMLGGVALGLGLWSVGRDGLGFVWPGGWSFVTWSLGLTVAGMAIVYAFVGVRRALGIEESDFLRHMLPRTPDEKRTFVLLSFSAGLGEELVYRSYLIAMFTVVFGGPWVAALVAALLFATVHAYQGALGLVRVALLGILLATPLLVVGSIWPAMAAHTGIDLLAGLVFADRLTDPLSPPESTPDGD